MCPAQDFLGFPDDATFCIALKKSVLGIETEPAQCLLLKCSGNIGLNFSTKLGLGI